MVELLGILAATLTMFSFVPQITKIRARRSAGDVSLVTIGQFSCGSILWTAYGVCKRDLIIIIANVVTLTTLCIIIYLFFRYKAAPQKTSI